MSDIPCASEGSLTRARELLLRECVALIGDLARLSALRDHDALMQMIRLRDEIQEARFEILGAAYASRPDRRGAP